jgi:hypothetical protein
MGRLQTDQIPPTAETLNNVLCNDVVQTGTMDWTVYYHSDNYRKMLTNPGPLNLDTLGSLPFNEQTGVKGCLPGPIFNILQPEIQNAIKAFFQDTCRAYRDYPAFKGITVTMWTPTMLWFGSMRAGYDDFTIGLFETENNIKIPVEAHDQKRFSKRFKWLEDNCREKWIDWRCRKIAAFICELRDVMRAERDDLRLSLTMWNEPYIQCVCCINTPESQITTRKSNAELYRESGIDTELFAVYEFFCSI